MPLYPPAGGGGVSNHNILDGSVHSDSVAQGVTRGSMLVGNATPKWDEMVLGGARKAVMSDGTDVLWRYPGAVYLATATASASATVDFTLTSPTNSDFAAYLVTLSHVIPVTDATTLFFRTSTDGGSTFDAGASDYKWTCLIHGSVAAVSTDTADNEIQLTGASDTQGNAANETLSGFLVLYNPSAAQYGSITFTGMFNQTSSIPLGCYTMGQRLSAADVDAIRFLYSSGNISSGVFKLYGLPAA